MMLPKQGHAWILGAGISGEAAARLLLGRGWRVTVIDSAAEEKIGAAADRLRSAGATVLCGCARLPDVPADCAVVSPGMPADAPLRAEAACRAVPVFSELEVGARFVPCPMIAVTGSKGKSSLVKVIADTLGLAGLRAEPGGNFGTALSTLADGRPLDWAVVECSSFQLETVDAFRPRIGILLNLSPDHLDRHGTMERYRDTKLRMLARQEASDVALLPSGPDPWGLRDAAGGVGLARRELFGVEGEATWRYEPGHVVRRMEGSDAWVDIAGSPFDNPVLGRAAAAGVAALWHAGLDDGAISRGFKTYQPLAHRMQPVAEIGGVRYVDDSKATSLTAQLAAVRMLAGPKRLIAGGRLKEKSVDTAKELLTAGVRKAYLIGECARELEAAWSPHLAVQVCGTLEAAVACAGREAEPGDTVLLSPGTASYDQFRDFQDRGNAFAALVRQLDEGVG